MFTDSNLLILVALVLINNEDTSGCFLIRKKTKKTRLMEFLSFIKLSKTVRETIIWPRVQAMIILLVKSLFYVLVQSYAFKLRL